MHLLNFRTAKEPDAKFEYNFRMVSLYLVQPTEGHDFSTPSRRKRGPDEWMVTPPRTRNAARVVNPLEWDTTSRPKKPKTEAQDQIDKAKETIKDFKQLVKDLDTQWKTPESRNEATLYTPRQSKKVTSLKTIPWTGPYTRSILL